MADDVTLQVNGKRYGGWKSIRITRSIESIAGSFTLDVSDRWDGASDPWPIAEGDVCRVLIDEVVVIDGYVDKRSISGDASARTLGYSGRDRAGDLVDCSAIIEEGTVSKRKWTFHNVDVAQVAAEVCRPLGIPVSTQAGLGALLTKNAKIVMAPGDTGFEVISKIAAAAGVLVVSDGAGGIVITRAGTARSASIVEGQNLKSGSVDFDNSDRYGRYLITSQIPGTDEASGEATRILAEATDPAINPRRVLIIRPDKSYNADDAKRRADWEARVRAARAEKVSVVVQGWRQPNGQLWPVNVLTRVRAPRLLGIDGDLLISQVEFTIGEGGRATQLSLVRPDAFTPEPTATVHESGGAWKELAKGGL